MNKSKRKTMKILPKYLDLVINGKKKAEVRSWLDTGLINNYIGLENTETKRVEAVIFIDDIFDLDYDFSPEQKEDILDDLQVDDKFREDYDCRYLYSISEVHTVH